MNTLKQLAINLENIAGKYAQHNEEAKKLLHSLGDFIYRAKNGIPIGREEKIPGFYWFSEGSLSQYRDLEDAYSQFAVFIAAGTESEYEKILQKVDDILK